MHQLLCKNNDYTNQSMMIRSNDKGWNIPQSNDDGLMEESLRGIGTSKPKFRVIVATILVTLAFGIVICALRDAPTEIDGRIGVSSREQQNKTADLYKCPAHRYTQGKWELKGSLDQWTVASSGADEECELESFSKERFCEVLNNRNILLVGDSVNKNLFQTFLHAFQTTATVEQTIWSPHWSPHESKKIADVHDSATICNHSTVAFIRNDYLTVDRMLSAHNHTSVRYLTPWIQFLKYNDVLILNSGAHPVPIQEYANSLRKLKDFLVENYNGTVLFRTTPRGHVGCKPNDKPIKEVNDSDWKRFFTSLPPEAQSKYEKFRWGLFPAYNEMMKEIAAPYTVIDIAPLFELRPDVHKAAEGDCLHIVNYDALQTFLQLAMNALLGKLE